MVDWMGEPLTVDDWVVYQDFSGFRMGQIIKINAVTVSVKTPTKKKKYMYPGLVIKMTPEQILLKMLKS